MPQASRKSRASATLAERLGFSARDRLLIVNCDDFGSSRSANMAIERALRHGIASSTTLMVPCPWAQDAAQSCRDLDIGVHITLTSEYPAYRWHPLTNGKTLRDNDGYLPATAHEVWAKADLADVERECRAQIDRALDWRVDVTHLDSHMDTMQLDRGYFELYMRLAASYGVPLRLRRPRLAWPFSYISRATLDRAGILTTDSFVTPPWGEAARAALSDCIRRLPRGVTEIAVHPVDDGDELRAYDREYADVRVADAECLLDETLRKLIESSGARLIGFKPLRDAMRALGA